MRQARGGVWVDKDDNTMSEGFNPAWLDLREPADHAARESGLLRAFADALSHLDAPRITDLGSGTGSTLRAVSPLVPDARWRLVDSDPVLLAEARRRAPAAAAERADLATGLEDVFAPAGDAVTASALIDLVSRDWLERLARAAKGRILYIALTYNGAEHWQPGHPDDAEILKAFGRHQRTDKGFGPALGPDAAPVLADMLSGAGWRVRTADSPWRLDRASHGALMDALADGVASAARESGVKAETTLRWRKSRQKSSACIVGHTDILATP